MNGDFEDAMRARPNLSNAEFADFWAELHAMRSENKRLLKEIKGARQGVERDRQNTRLVYNKETKKIDLVRGNKGLVVGSFDPPEEI